MSQLTENLLFAGILFLIPFETVRAVETHPIARSGKILLPGTIDVAGLGPKNNKPPTR